MKRMGNIRRYNVPKEGVPPFNPENGKNGGKIKNENVQENGEVGEGSENSYVKHENEAGSDGNESATGDETVPIWKLCSDYVKDSVGYPEKSVGKITYESAMTISRIGGAATFVGEKILRKPKPPAATMDEVQKMFDKGFQDMKEAMEESHEKTITAVTQILADDKKEREELALSQEKARAEAAAKKKWFR